jgi:hypothetical protein
MSVLLPRLPQPSVSRALVARLQAFCFSAFRLIAYCVIPLYFIACCVVAFCLLSSSSLLAQPSSLRLATTATLQPRWTALTSHKVYLLTTAATQARGQNVMGILAATNKGLFQSLDTGQTWNSLGLSNDEAYDALIFNGALIAATDKGVQTRASGASAWQTQTFPVVNGNAQSNGAATQATVQHRVLPTYALHSVGTSLYAGTTRGVYHSADGGATWTRAGADLADKTVRSIVSLGSTLFAAVWNDGVYRSHDNGATWTLADIVPGSRIARTFRTLSAFGSLIYAGSSEGNLYQSSDGVSWTCVVSAGNNGQSGVNARGVEAVARWGTTIIGAVYNGVAYSHDNGQTWSLMRIATQDVGTMVILPPKQAARRSLQTATAWEKGGASLQSEPCGPDAISCGGGSSGGVAVGGGSGVSGYGLPECNPLGANLTIEPATAPSQANALQTSFSISVSASAALDEFRIEMASPNAPSSWINVTSSYTNNGGSIVGTATIPAEFMQTQGTYQMRAYGIQEGPCMGAYVSETRSFVVTSAPPTLTAAATFPSPAIVGQDAALTLTGANLNGASVSFAPSLMGVWNAQVSADGTSLTATIRASAAPANGIVEVSVAKLVGDSFVSVGPLALSVQNPVPTITANSLAPTQVLVHQASAFSLSGANFVQGATVLVNGVSVTPSVASASSLNFSFTPPSGGDYVVVGEIPHFEPHARHYKPRADARCPRGGESSECKRYCSSDGRREQFRSRGGRRGTSDDRWLRKSDRKPDGKPARVVAWFNQNALGGCSQ